MCIGSMLSQYCFTEHSQSMHACTVYIHRVLSNIHVMDIGDISSYTRESHDNTSGHALCIVLMIRSPIVSQT